MKVLVACEYSGVVRDAFRARGHDAISCDLLPTDAPGPHHQGDIIKYLEPFPDGYFDLIIAHPECTRLCVSGNRWYGKGMPKHQERIDSAAWTEDSWNLAKRKAKSVCFENPVGVLPKMTSMGRPQYVHPWQFGHMEQKKTGLWLHNLPPLIETENVYEKMMELPKRERERLHYLPPSADRWKIRSTTYTGIANAMAEQWGKPTSRATNND